MLISSCGFYLRTTTLGSYLSSVHVDAAQAPIIEQELIRAFSHDDVAIVESENAELSVRLRDFEFQKSTSLVVPREGLIEYDLVLQTSLVIWFDGDENSSEEVSFSQAGRVRVHPNRLLSTSAEEQTVREELVQGVIEDFLLDLYLRFVQDPESE